jgi:hypothetical protein
MASHKVNVSAGVLLFLHIVDYLRWSKEQLQLFEGSLGTSGVNFAAELCPQGGIVDGAAMVIGDTGDWYWVDSEVGGEGREVESELDSLEVKGYVEQDKRVLLETRRICLVWMYGTLL